MYETPKKEISKVNKRNRIAAVEEMEDEELGNDGYTSTAKTAAKTTEKDEERSSIKKDANNEEIKSPSIRKTAKRFN